jgi:hypothetical protein
MFHNCTTVLMSLGICLSLATAARSEDKPFQLTEEQKKMLEEFQKAIQAPTENPNDADAHLKSVQDRLNNFLAIKDEDSRLAANTLAGTLVQGVNSDQIGVDATVGLSKELLKVLSLPSIGYNDTNTFVKSIEPLVQSTNLRGVEKMRLYNDALKVVITSPAYNPPGR